MKSTGIVRKVDELGRIVVPIELRRMMNIDIKDPLEIYVDEDKVILKKYQASEDKEKALTDLRRFQEQAIHENDKKAYQHAINLIEKG